MNGIVLVLNQVIIVKVMYMLKNTRNQHIRLDKGEQRYSLDL